MSSVDPAHDLLEILQQEDITLSFAELQLGNRRTAQVVLTELAANGLVQLYQVGEQVAQHRLNAVLSDPTAWLHENHSTVTVIYSGCDDACSKFFQDR